MRAPLRSIDRPEPGEYPAYAEMYMKLIPRDGRVLEHLAAGLQEAEAFIRALPPARLLHRYAEGKWSIKEILVHIVDDERIYAYRALRFARGEAQSMPGFDENAYAAASRADDRPLDSIFEEYAAVRQATIALFKGLPEDAFLRMGTGSTPENRTSVRALAYHIAGHERHHLNVIRERYL
ncbi:MAG TPA: DinB family protein [Holophagaceae bacterium]|nr:DinB family protein [Holophagaceae bacterium]